jgi:UDP-N-acetylmuramoyl-L-alanyl-D-glutamate--2,6-diaminopimelate ligase
MFQFTHGRRNLLLSDLVPQFTDIEITGITADSRQVKPGFVFAAVPGSITDGRKFIPVAVAQGAAAIVTTLDYDAENCPVPCHKVADPRKELASFAAKIAGTAPAMMAAVTGTNGKTSVAHFLRSLWEKTGHKAASLGTLGVVTGEQVDDLHVTTPEPVMLHGYLHQLAENGVTHAVLEASSHGLDQRRLDATDISVAGFTNLSRDHLDYHKTEEEYLRAKLGLISRVVVDGGTVVLNADSNVFEDFKASASNRGLNVISYGYKGEDFVLEEAISHSGGQALTFTAYGDKYQIDLPLIGTFQALNILCALGMAIASGIDAARAIYCLPDIENVPGRMEKVATLSKGASVYVDFAHTPDALETVLKSARPHTRGKLICVFGCGGDRDIGKRPQMGEIAASLAEVTIVTDDNPRSEEPAQIRAEILAACKGGIEFGDRATAISKALEMSEPGDVIIVAGKGHEDGQIIGETVIPFHDKTVIQGLVQKGGLA